MKKSLRIAYNFNESTKGLDPANIQTIYQANLIENLYTRLIDYDDNGQLKCTLCSKFWVENNTINFEILKGIKTQSGHELSANDVQVSLRRLFDLNTNTHGNLLHFISKREDLYLENNIFKIKLKESHYSQFVLPLLASMDFSIIPTISINSNNNIFDFKNTFGAYFLEKDSLSGNLLLNANFNNPLFSQDMFKSIEIIPTDSSKIIDSFLHDKVDVIDVTCYPRSNLYEQLFDQKVINFNVEKTIPINLFYIAISPKLHRTHSQEQIFYALNLISSTYLKFKTYGFGFLNKNEFFSDFGNGHLTLEQIKQIEKLRVQKLVKFNRPIELGVLESNFNRINEAFKNVNEIKVVSFKSDPAFLPLKERPDVYIQTTDSSFNEDISLISYNFSMEYLGNTIKDGEKWINEYIDISNKEDRIKKLQDLHFKILKKPFVYPVGSSPYWAVSKPNLKLNFPKLFPGSHWWKIRQI